MKAGNFGKGEKGVAVYLSLMYLKRYMRKEKAMSMLPLSVKFYRGENGREPVREWLKALGRPDSAIIGECIGVVQRGWPIGMPVCRPMGNGLYEVRADLPGNRIARVLFCFVGNMIILLHSFIKKTQKTPDTELRIARERQSKCQAKKGNAT